MFKIPSQILRLMGVKCRPGSLGKGELCRTTVAFDLACRALDCPVPRGTVFKLSSAPEAVYATSLCTAQRLLGTGKRYTCEEVAKEVTDMRVGIKAAAELKKYQVGDDRPVPPMFFVFFRIFRISFACFMVYSHKRAHILTFFASIFFNILLTCEVQA